MTEVGNAIRTSVVLSMAWHWERNNKYSQHVYRVCFFYVFM